MILIRALEWNVGTWSFDVKGKVEDGRPIEMKVPRQDIGGGAIRCSDEACESGGNEGVALSSFGCWTTTAKGMKPVMPLVGQNFTSWCCGRNQ